jgi:hypothetical protein
MAQAFSFFSMTRCHLGGALGCFGCHDFTTIEVWTKSGLQTFYLIFIMEIATKTLPRFMQAIS